MIEPFQKLIKKFLLKLKCTEANL